MEKLYNYSFTPRAYEDIENALNYISDTLQNPNAASDLWEKLEKRIDAVRLFPYSYPDCRIYSIPDKSYRHLVLGNYILIFHITEEKRTVEILRFIYGKANIEKPNLSEG